VLRFPQGVTASADHDRSHGTGRAARAAALARAWFEGVLDQPAPALALVGALGLGTAVLAVALLASSDDPITTGRPAIGLGVAFGIGVVGLTGAFAVRVATSSQPPDSGVRTPAIFRSVFGALVLLLPLVLVPVLLFLGRATDTGELVLFPPLLDKRYLLASYYIVVLGVPLALLVSSRLTSAFASEQVPSATTTWSVADALHRLPPAVRRLLAVLAGVATATYFYGPPWGGRPLAGAVDYHETVHFTGLQAIHAGAVPYVGAASDQYGPASQLFNYGWMELVGGFNLAGFREAYVAQHWLAIAFVCAVVLLFLPVRAAVLGIALAILVFPLFQFFGFDVDGYRIASYWGWGNLWRYAGLLLLGLALPRLMLRDGCASRWSFGVLGAVWGLTCLLAQENLFGGVLVIAVVALALILSASVPRDLLGRALLAIGIGWAALIGPVLVAYAALGELGPFIRNYFIVTMAVSGGYSNTIWWQDSAWYTTYILLPVLTLACGLIALTRTKPLSIVGGWSLPRGLLFGCFVAAAVAQATALFRADSSHLVNVMLITPILVGATAVMAGSLLDVRDGFWRLVLGVGVVLVALAVLPGDAWSFSLARDRLTAPVDGRTAAYDAPPGPRVPRGVAADRVGPYAALPRCCTATAATGRELVRFADRVHELVGNRTTFVSRSVAGGEPGVVYFVADLHPFDLPLEPTSMAIDRQQVIANRRAIADKSNRLDAVVTDAPREGSSRVAIARLGPHPRVHMLELGGKQVRVLIASRRPS